ncbi:MAG: ATP-binding protein [Bacteroidetes bacterium]|nr:ATP-binding protein [Bacteroidota bacterium]
MNEQLEKRVIQRTVELERANRELEAFSYSVSHDLRAPLRSIDGWSLALMEDYADRLDDEGRGYLKRVRNETQRMGQLINDLLQLSRVTRTEMTTVEVDLSALMQRIAKRAMDNYADRRIHFVIQPGLVVSGDSQLLEIALTNLVDNACKFTGNQPEALIEFGKTEDPEQSSFFIRDNGVGFDMDFAKNLFGAFQRMHKQSEFQGTGIGLATVQRIIHRHNGQIWVNTAVNQGATFYFTLP